MRFVHLNQIARTIPENKKPNVQIFFFKTAFLISHSPVHSFCIFILAFSTVILRLNNGQSSTNVSNSPPSPAGFNPREWYNCLSSAIAGWPNFFPNQFLSNPKAAMLEKTVSNLFCNSSFSSSNWFLCQSGENTFNPSESQTRSNRSRW